MGQPNAFVPVALWAFVVAVGVAFAWLEARRAVLSAVLGGWLFLPEFDRRFSFFVLSSKAAFVPAIVILGSFLFDAPRWRGFRPRLLDLPVALLCAVPFVTALQNDLGVYEASSAALDAAATWGAPYLLGRAYLGRPRAVRELATAVVVAALAYSPFILWEAKFSPQLHETLYGYKTTSWETASRYGGWRPDVFLQSGLAVGMFLAIATLAAVWLWRTGARTALAGIPMAWVWPVLVVVTIVCRATGAILLLGVGLAVLEGCHRLRTSALVLVLLLAPSAFCAARISGWDAQAVVRLAERAINGERAWSLQFRIRNEDRLIQRAMARPWFGWGRFGRSFVRDGSGKMVVIDSMWIIALGFTGLVGLASLLAALAAPALALMRTYPPRYWGDPRLAPAAALAVGVLLWAIDDVLNAMPSPVYPAFAGAAISFVGVTRAVVERRPVRLRSPGGRHVVQGSSPG